MDAEIRACPACQTPTRSDAAFCPKCGSSMDPITVGLRDIERLKDRVHHIESALASSWVFSTNPARRAVAIWAHTFCVALVIGFVMAVMVALANIK